MPGSFPNGPDWSMLPDRPFCAKHTIIQQQQQQQSNLPRHCQILSCDVSTTLTSNFANAGVTAFLLHIQIFLISVVSGLLSNVTICHF